MNDIMKSGLDAIMNGGFRTISSYCYREFQEISLYINKKHNEYVVKKQCHEIIGDDWDFLIILDSCRYDTFSKINWFNGKLESRYSAGGNSFEFIEANFSNKNLFDTVCISANPNTARIDDNVFHAHELVDDRKGIPMSPEKMVDAAIEAVHKFKNKRLIFYFMEPHYPYTDEYGLSLAEEYAPSSYEDSLNLSWPISAINYKKEHAPPPSEVKTAYCKNLEYGLKAVETLLPKLDGKTIITSDHGELLGERLSPIPVKYWGHAGKIHHKQLRKVPWFIIESETRRSITSDPPVENEVTNDNEIESRLRALGYK